MTKEILIGYLNCLVICSVVSYVSSLTLANQVTSKPRLTKYSSSTVIPGSGSLVTPANQPVTPASNDVSYYRVRDSSGITCILLKTDALIEINFKSHIGEEQGDTYIPEKATVEGSCKDEDEATMRILWPGYSLQFDFAKTPGGERWYVDNVALIVSTDIPIYHNIRSHGNVIRLYHEKMLLPTPVGKSYGCEETIITLFPNIDDTPPEGLRGTVYLRKLQLQSFMYKGKSFGPVFDCNSAKSFRDETAPIAVGSTLAIAVLGTVTGYGIFRYLKIKKVQYNNME